VAAVKPIEDWPQQQRLTHPANQPSTDNRADTDDRSASSRAQAASKEPNKQGRKQQQRTRHGRARRYNNNGNHQSTASRDASLPHTTAIHIHATTHRIGIDNH
jgi:hypothetical protein